MICLQNSSIAGMTSDKLSILKEGDSPLCFRVSLCPMVLKILPKTIAIFCRLSSPKGCISAVIIDSPT